MSFWFLVVVVGCGDDSIAVDAGADFDAARDGSTRDAGGGPDTGGVDGGAPDANAPDASAEDGGALDAGGCEIDCDALDDACNDWSCDGATAECTPAPRADGTACDDGDACTMVDGCVAGECEGSAIDCSGSGDACNTGECDPMTGSCIATPLPDGTMCDDADLCSTGDSCRAGTCAGAPLDCSGLTDMCNTGRCNPATGTCLALPVADGTRCDDGARCTTTDSCRSGLCSGTTVDCSAMADMCNTAMCDPATGACLRRPVTPGTACNDGRSCTSPDRCDFTGVCQGIVNCPSVMCRAGMCDPATGDCASVPLPDGSACDDGNACTTERCMGGSCASTLVCREPLRVVTFGTLTDTPLRGGAGGTLTEDACSERTALVGVTGELHPSGWIGRLRGLCGNLRLMGSGAGPYTIDVPSVGSMTTLRGLVGGGGTITSMCPPNTVVVGFDGRAASLVDQIALRCAPLAVGSTPTEFVVNTGTLSFAPPAGGTGGVVFGTTSCPAGQVASEIRIRSGDSIDAFGVGCRFPRLTYPITMSARTPTATQGGAGGVAFADACPAGRTIDLYDGFLDSTTGNTHGQIRADCQRYEVVGPVGAPSGVSNGIGGTTPYRGMTGTFSWIRSCGSVDRQSVVVGFEGRGGSLIDQLTFRCGRLTPNADGTISVGAAVGVAPIGGTGGTAFPITSCPAGMIATEARGRAALAVDAIGLGCSTPTW